MKIHKYIVALAAFAAAFTSCTESIESQMSLGNEMTITASHADKKTRTSLLDAGTKIYWEPGDELKVFYEDGYGRLSSDLTENAEVAKFRGSFNIAVGYNETSNYDNMLWGLYPYRSDATFDGESITTTLPAEQTGRANTFAKNTWITVGRSISMSIGFYNVCGGLRFSLTHEGVKSVRLEGRADEALSGRIKIGFDGNTPVINQISDTSRAITLTAPYGGTFETGKWYYITAVPTELTNGYKLTFSTGSETAVRTSTSAVSIQRGKFGSISEADAGLIYSGNGGGIEPLGDYIEFKDPIAKYACVEKFDTDSDGEVSFDEAAAVSSISGLFTDYNTVTSFDELKYFTGIKNLGSALRGLKSLKSVTIPTGCTSIEDNAFDDCSALDSVTFAGNNIKTFGYRSFYKCSSLTKIVVPEGVESLSMDTFSECTALASLTLPTSLISLGDYVLNNCFSLKSIDLPSGVVSIGQYAFNSCTLLASIDIPSGVRTINRYCFQNCSALASIGLPSSLETIKEWAFSGCSSISSVDLPTSLQTIERYAFQNCQSLSAIIIPDNVTSMGDNVFNGCIYLVSVKLPSEMTSIPSGTFSGCINLCSVTFPDAVTTIGDDAFRYCAFFNNTSKISKIELPSTVTTIGGRAFNNARNILIPSSSFVNIQSNTFSTGTKIYVPDAKVDLYKVRTNWSTFADHIFPLSSYSDEPFEMESVDLGLSVKWAKCNLGAIKPEQYGTYFAWGDVNGQLWGDGWSGGGFSSYPSYQLDANNNLKPEYDAAHVNLGGSWRMPTKTEFEELINNCTCTWTSNYNGTGVAGRIFTSKKTGYTDKSIFLPAAGYGSSSNLNIAGSDGYYWSSTFGSVLSAWYLDFYSDDVYTYSYYRIGGRSVRPVTE